MLPDKKSKQVHAIPARFVALRAAVGPEGVQPKGEQGKREKEY